MKWTNQTTRHFATQFREEDSIDQFLLYLEERIEGLCIKDIRDIAAIVFPSGIMANGEKLIDVDFWQVLMVWKDNLS